MGETFKDSNKSFICSFFNCKASFSKSWKLEAHLCKHTGLRPFACESCDQSFCTRYQLTRHQLSHSGEKPYQCSVEGCSEAFVTPASMKNHVARVHQQEKKQYVCDYAGCGKAFHKSNQLKTHKCEHTLLLPFQCSLKGCERKFSASKPLERHEKVHAGYPCVEEGCSFQGKTWTDYQKHRSVEHRVVLQCDGCKKVFLKAWFLQKHQQRVHSGERQVFKCPKEGCQKIYTTHFNLQNHVRSFHELKIQFTCSHAGCSKTFAMEESLKRHSVVHDPERKKLQKHLPQKGSPKKSQKKASGVTKLAARLQIVTLSKSTSPDTPQP